MEKQFNEIEFQSLWGLYICAVIGNHLISKNQKKGPYSEFIETLQNEGLLDEKKVTINTVLSTVKEYIKGMFNAKKEFSISNNMDGSWEGKIKLDTPTIKEQKMGYTNIDQLLSKIDKSFQKQGVEYWVCFDRLDVAFETYEDIEIVALKTLIKQYLDMKDLSNIKLKIFLRSDLFNKITEKGFRESTHITRDGKITWDKETILNMIMLRLTTERDFCNSVGYLQEEILASLEKQEEVFYQIFPAKVDGKKGADDKKTDTLNWLVSRTMDASKAVNPRDILYLLDNAKSLQQDLNSKGGKIEDTISKKALKLALDEASRFKLEQFLYAEYPDVKAYVEAFREKKASQNLQTLSSLWGTDTDETKKVIDELNKFGFISKETNNEVYTVPFIYRPALAIKQGKQF